MKLVDLKWRMIVNSFDGQLCLFVLSLLSLQNLNVPDSSRKSSQAAWRVILLLLLLWPVSLEEQFEMRQQLEAVLVVADGVVCVVDFVDCDSWTWTFNCASVCVRFSMVIMMLLVLLLRDAWFRLRISRPRMVFSNCHTCKRRPTSTWTYIEEIAPDERFPWARDLSRWFQQLRSFATRSGRAAATATTNPIGRCRWTTKQKTCNGSWCSWPKTHQQHVHTPAK